MNTLGNLMAGILTLLALIWVPVPALAAIDTTQPTASATGLVGWWKMDGDWKDSSVVGNNGTPSNGASFSTNAKVGGQSGSFDGVNDYVSFGNVLNMGSNNFTIAAWINAAEFKTGSGAKIINKGLTAYGTPASAGFGLRIVNEAGANKAKFIVYGIGTGYVVEGSGLQVGQWYHLAGVREGTKIKLYVDGLLAATTDTGSILNTNTNMNLALGALQRLPVAVDAEFFHGLIDEATIFNRALSDTEVQEQYRKSAVKPPPGAPTIDPVSAPINTTATTITGTSSSESSSIVVSCAGAQVDAVSYPSATSWSADLSGLREGSNTITAYAVNAGGTPSATTTATITVDTTPPVVGATPAGGIYNSPQSVALAANGPAVIYYTTDGSAPTLTAAKYSQPIPIPAGTTLRYFGRDLAGNNSEIQTEEYVIDTTPPVLALSTLSAGAYTNNETLNIAGTVTDSAGVKGITVNDTAVPVNADGSFSHALLLRDGVNIITVAATDSAGNVATETRRVTLDQTAPTLAVVTPADNSKTGQVLLEVSGTVDKTSNVTVKRKDVVQNAVMDGGAFSATIILDPGYDTIEIVATDLAGNQSSLKRTVVFDDQVPSLAVTVPNQDLRTNQSTLTIKGTVYDALTAVGVTITKDNEIFTPPVIDGTFEQVMNLSEEKTYDIVVRATNEVGTSTSVQRNVIYDITPPALSIDPVTTPTSQPNPSVSGTREAGTTVTATCATATVGEVSYPTSTTWRVDFSGLREGENVITAASADAAGNAVRATATVVLASRPPEITITATPDVIWPPNHRMVPVTIAGGIKTYGPDIESVYISVSDEYGKHQYNHLKFGSTVMLEAWRKGDDKDGRKYTITVVVTDKGGVTTAKTASVTVPHSQKSR